MAQGDKVPVNTLSSLTMSFACGCSFSVTNGTVKFAGCGTESKNHRQQEAAMQIARSIVQKMHEFQVVSGN